MKKTQDKSKVYSRIQKGFVKKKEKEEKKRTEERK
jgi:hypothetical protein